MKLEPAQGSSKGDSINCLPGTAGLGKEVAPTSSKGIGKNDHDERNRKRKSEEAEMVTYDDDLSNDNEEEYKKKQKKKKVKELDEKSLLPPTKGAQPAQPRCATCRQRLDDPDLKFYLGHPEGAVEEFVALTDPKLSLFTGNEESIHEDDQRPQQKVTSFSVYDSEGHLCPFDSGIIESNKLLYFSGYVKAIYEENPDIEGGIPVKDMGPINEWWVSGYDGGELALMGFATAYGEYYLMEPSEEYASFMVPVREKIYLSKIVIEFLLDEPQSTYEDLLNKLQTTVPPSGLGTFNEEKLLRHAQFICDQAQSFDSAAPEDDDGPQVITLPCMRALVKLAGITVGKRLAMRRTARTDLVQKKKTWTKATTTELVQSVFENLFTDQLDVKDKCQGPRRKRCGVCEACQERDCGKCVACRDMTKFGGSGRSKQACVRRRCPNMAIQEADDWDDENNLQSEEDIDPSSWLMPLRSPKKGKTSVKWLGEPCRKDGERLFYTGAFVGKEEIHVNDYVVMEPQDPSVPVYVARVAYLYQDGDGSKIFHAQWLCRGTDTVLGETADGLELFFSQECEDCLLTLITHKAKVHLHLPGPDWHTRGGESLSKREKPVAQDDGRTFWVQKMYVPEYGRFVDVPEKAIPELGDVSYDYCWLCENLFLEHTDDDLPITGPKLEEQPESGEMHYEFVKWQKEKYQPGQFIFLNPDAFKFRIRNSTVAPVKKDEEPVDEDIYPEFYRKSVDGGRSLDDVPEPFRVGYISNVLTKGKNRADVYLRVTKMYRPENTHRGITASYQADINLLYWSSEEAVVKCSQVTGRCNVVYGENLEVPISAWAAAGPHRFYFTMAYDSNTKTFDEPPSSAMSIGRPGKGKGKGKGKAKKRLGVQAESDPNDKVENKEGMAEWPTIGKPLRMLDVFAGCGGLSEGLHQSGVAETCWAVEKEEPAAHAFRLNHPRATVFTDDCNDLLRMVIEGNNTDTRGQKLPQKGEVDLMCGGPPCQGFSGMNRFNSREYSAFKNSLIVSYLSYCDYYRPQFFILENVRNFLSFKNNMVLKLTLRCLVAMGYQCTFGVLQAGNFGVPQTRRRAIVLAAAPGEKLPSYPEPLHVFNQRGTLHLVTGGKKFVTGCRWQSSAPYRTINVRDAMSDLPAIRNGAQKEEIQYGEEPLSHFQKVIRGNQYQPILRDHICKDMAALVEARISHVPIAPGSDWRDLPNIVVRLSDGTYTRKLEYLHHDKRNGRSKNGAMRGVCPCATGKQCDPLDRQYNTLIPWCLPHTGNRHNNWSGLYGRLEWDGIFSTTVTNPEPMGKQGRVLHPEQHRVVSVRECARSQGFPDTYRFFGSILDKHRQVGNAVPPPMGLAIGREILKSVASREDNNCSMITAAVESKMEVKEEI